MRFGSKQQWSETGKKYQINVFFLQGGCEPPRVFGECLRDLLLEIGVPGIAPGYTRCCPF